MLCLHQRYLLTFLKDYPRGISEHGSRETPTNPRHDCLSSRCQMRHCRGSNVRTGQCLFEYFDLHYIENSRRSWTAELQPPRIFPSYGIS
jgi:hypothetical protein